MSCKEVSEKKGRIEKKRNIFGESREDRVPLSPWETYGIGQI